MLPSREGSERRRYRILAAENDNDEHPNPTVTATAFAAIAANGTFVGNRAFPANLATLHARAANAVDIAVLPPRGDRQYRPHNLAANLAFA